jgi:hypothetical protein
MPLTDFSAWVGLYTSSAQHDVKYQIWYLRKTIVEWDLNKYTMKNILRTAKFLSTWGLSQKYVL